MSDTQPQFDTSHAKAQIRAERLRQNAGQALDAPTTCPKEQWPPDLDKVLAWRRQQEALFELEPSRIRGARLFYRDHPIEFINHWCDTYDPRNVGTGKPVRLPFIMFPRQEELARFVLACMEAEAPGLVEKSRDMGATWVCLCLSTWLWLFWPGTAIGWGSRKQEQVDRIGDPSSLFEKLRMEIKWLAASTPFVPKLNPEHLKQYTCINPENNSTISGEIGDNIGRGGRTRVYFVDEAAHLERPELVEAALSENTRVRIDISSVSLPGTVFHRTRESGVDWVPGAKAVKGTTNVFVMDWSDHPEKTEEWHTSRKQYFQNKGLPHVFAREIERDYTAAVEGVIIPQEWVKAAVDADKTLNWPEQTGDLGGLDVADEGLDRNALALRRGSIVCSCDEWGERDTGATARRAVTMCSVFMQAGGSGNLNLQYDCIGVGAGIKAETNRLRDDGLLPEGLVLTPWNAGAGVLYPNKRLLTLDNGEEDLDSPKNKDYYANLKAQAWWELRMRFYRTYQAVKEGKEFDPDELISLPSSLNLLRKIMKELSQAVVTKNSKLKLLVDKTPEGAASPNLADAIVMAFWPWIPPAPGRVSLFGPIIVRP